MNDNNNTENSNKVNINWFPGHMAKAKREIKEMLKLVDIVIELRDSRIPLASKNPMVDEIVGNKPRLIVLNKARMADNIETKKWITNLTNDSVVAIDIDCIDNYNINKLVPSMKLVLKDKILKDQSKGLINRGIRALVIGIPNVGKSTFINTLSKRKATKTGDRPGVTKGQTWIKISDELQLLDTPGILWPKFEDQQVGVKLSICGSIKDEIMDLEYISVEALKYLQELYPSLLAKRYEIDSNLIKDMSIEEIIDFIADKKKALISGGRPDLDRISKMILNDIRTCRIGAVTFEKAY